MLQDTEWSAQANWDGTAATPIPSNGLDLYSTSRRENLQATQTENVAAALRSCQKEEDTLSITQQHRAHWQKSLTGDFQTAT